MYHCFAPLHKDATLYSIVPLPLDLAHKEEHLKAILTETSDIQLLEKKNLPHPTFRFFDDTIAILNSFEKHNKEKAHAITAPPFTSLLLGPAYACHSIIQSYASWAHVDGRIFSISHQKKPHAQHMQKRHPHSISMWHEYSLPKVWARATISTVDIPCYIPHALEKELQIFFNAPIHVNAHAPYASYEHNECMAWLYAFYAVNAARLVGRTALCHYQSINMQYKLWVSNKEKAEKIFPKPWTLILEREKITHRCISQEMKNSTQNSACAATVIEKSNYNTKKLLYNKTKMHHAIIGFSCVRMPTFIDIHSYTLTLHKDKNNILLYLPFLPSDRALEAIKDMVHKISKTQVNTVHVDTREVKHLYPVMHSSYAIVGNLLLKALRTIKPNHTTITVAMPAAIHTCSTEIACVVEYKLTFYSKSISMHRIYLAINAGHIARKTFVSGNVEYIVQGAMKNLFGINTRSKRILELHTTFMQENTLFYTSSIRDTLYRAVTEATYDALKKHVHHKYFPMMCATHHRNSSLSA